LATFVTNKAKEQLLNATLDLDTNTIKIALFKTDPTATADMNFMSELTPGTNECDATNYVRKTVTLAAAENDTDDKAYLTISGNLTWTALGGASNNTVVAAALMKDAGGADSANLFIAWLDITNTPTNGGDFILSWTSNRVLELA
jgi:hypothetical protein